MRGKETDQGRSRLRNIAFGISQGTLYHRLARSSLLNICWILHWPWQVSRSLDLSREPTLDVHLVYVRNIYYFIALHGVGYKSHISSGQPPKS
jgi:hypothetical protein